MALVQTCALRSGKPMVSSDNALQMMGFLHGFSMAFPHRTVSFAGEYPLVI